MKSAKFVGRVGGLAVGLGIGSAMAAMPWVVSADPSADALSSIDLGGLALPGAADSASSFDFSNMSLSAFGSDSQASVLEGNNDVAAIFGDGSNSELFDASNSIAAALGDGQSASEAFGVGLTDIEPSSLAAIFDPSLAAGSVDATLLTEFLGLL
jgi:hypothetical protein